MLSGFILKGDADGLQAFRILISLIKQIPLIGNALSFTLLGREDDLQILYVNHIATATIFLWIIILRMQSYSGQKHQRLFHLYLELHFAVFSSCHLFTMAEIQSSKDRGTF